MKNSIVLFAMLVAAMIVQGCGRPELYGEAKTDLKATAISDILVDPDSYTGKIVKVSGKITTECSSGCWFDVGEGSVAIRVDIEPAGLAIPQRVGKNVVVEGTIAVEHNRLRLLGKGVEIR